MSDKSIVIASAVRTPIGNFQGVFQPLSATDLGAKAIAGALDAAGVKPEQPESVLMGCVLPAGLGQAPARMAAIYAGVPDHIGAVTINKVCGSGMKAIMLAHDGIKAGTEGITIAGGMESMTHAPYLLPKARHGYRLGHNKVLDHMFYDGLENPFERGKLMGNYADDTAEKYGFDRAEVDAFAIASLERAQKAASEGWFQAEIVPVDTGREVVEQDECPQVAKVDKIPKLKPAFKPDGVVTAANASSISDGAAAVILMTADRAEQLGCAPLARIVAHATHSQAPEWFTTAPIGAIEKVVAKAGWSLDEVDLVEINEAFAVVPMAAMHDLKLPHEKVNVHGGACALGHPVGASGTRIVVTLLHALRLKGLRKGVAAICLGGGESTAMAIEIL